MTENIFLEGQTAAPFAIYILGFDWFANPDRPIKRAAECWTEDEVRSFKAQGGTDYVVVVGREMIPLQEFKAGKRG